MYSLNFLLTLLIITIAHSQTLAPVSTCLANCLACTQQSPRKCLKVVSNANPIPKKCIPFYSGQNCERILSNYQNLYNQSTLFNRWSEPLTPPRQTCNLRSSQSINNTITTLGPFSTNLNATKLLQFSPTQNVERIIIKIGIAVSDAALIRNSSISSVASNATTSSSTTINQQGVQQTIIEVSQSSSTSNTLDSLISLSGNFLNLIVSNQSGSNLTPIAQFILQYTSSSFVSTSCGFVFQYQIIIDSRAPRQYFRQVLLNFYLPRSKPGVAWYLINFQASVGCNGYSVSTGISKCNSCLTGFYAEYDQHKNLAGCKICDYSCISCQRKQKCLLCEIYATSDSLGSCKYSENYRNFREFNVISGQKLAQSSYFENFYGSKSRILNINLVLKTIQSYFIKFHMLYTSNFAANMNSMNIEINGKIQRSLTDLDILSSTLVKSINNADIQMYMTTFRFDLTKKIKNQNFSLRITTVGSRTLEEFYLANLILVQYQCSQNCMICDFDPNRQTTCTRCAPFFSLTSNCKACVNGFFQQSATVCVKCYSNCKQCINSNSFACTECLANFQLRSYSFNRPCINCLYNLFSNKGSNIKCDSLCPFNITYNQLNAQSNCKLCFEKTNSNTYQDETCLPCWLQFKIASGKCIPTTVSNFQLYANDLTDASQQSGKLWTGSQALTNYNCSDKYRNLLGITKKLNSTNLQGIPSQLNFNMNNLPRHEGAMIIFNIFKVDSWSFQNTANTNNTRSQNNNFNIIISSNVANAPFTSFNLSGTNDNGADICGGPEKQMIWTSQIDLSDHKQSTLNVNIKSPDENIFVRQVEIYLKNCDNCEKASLSYYISYIPMYSDNSTTTGLDIWLPFSDSVSFKSQNNQSQTEIMNNFANSLRFTINNKQVTSSVLDNKLKQFNYIKYFIPLNQSFINGTITSDTNQAFLVYSDKDGAQRQLISTTQSLIVDRYVNASLDTRNSIDQLSNFMKFFTWFSLITIIVCVMLGVSVIFEQFLIIMQIIFYHIYITSYILPPSVKIPLAHAVRMQHLNYFANIRNIQDNLFGNTLFKSDFIFQQYNIDVLFLRSFYPIMIINAIYLGWFIILKLFYIIVPAFQSSQNKIIRFLRSIPQRPVAYFDQIWRYQFLATMWACMLQFTSFNATGIHVMSLVICVVAFVIAILWPLVLNIYVYRRHSQMNVNQFRYLYHDIYYLKISSVGQEPRYYIYAGVRYAKYFLYAAFIALFVNQSIIGPVLLIFVNIIEGVVVFFLKIYRNGYYKYTRIIENLLLCISLILCLIIFGFRNDDSFDSESYINLGYGLTTVFILMIFNAIFRFLYLTYKKISQWRIGTYDIGQHGEKQIYDNQSPIKIPQSQRLGQ